MSRRAEVKLMYRRIGLAASFMFALTVGVANATTFDLSGQLISIDPALPLNGPLTGTVTVTGGSVTAADVSYSLGGLSPFNGVFSSGPDTGNRWDLTLFSGSGDLLGLVLSLTPPAATLLGYAGGGFEIASLLDPKCNNYSCQLSSSQGSLTTGPVTTPLPAALPLFSTGLGAMALLGWRRKRKNASAISAA